MGSIGALTLAVVVTTTTACEAGRGPIQAVPAVRAAAPLASPSAAATEEEIGQRIVVGYPQAVPPPAVLMAARQGRIGGVILYQANVATRAAAVRSIARLQAAARSGGQPALLILVDQEGGVVKRFPALPPTLSAERMGRHADAVGTAEQQGYETGKGLRHLGVDVDLAPVADVPDRDHTFLRSRAFAHDPANVARDACGFAQGLNRAGVAATLKHFPGLGRAHGDTDLEHVTVRATARELRADLAPYATCGAPEQLAMVSSATYPSLGIRSPATIVPRTYALLRAIGFRGATMTDALDTASLDGVRRADRLAVNAGADLLVFAHHPALADRAYDELVADLRAGRLHPPGGVSASADRISALKRWLGRARPASP